MDPELMSKKLEYKQRKARAKALRLRLTCTICGEKAKLNCPCETTQCAPGARERVGGGALTRDATPQVLLDGLSTHRLARPRTSRGV